MMKRAIVAATLILGGILNAAQADTWVFRDTQRPGGHDRGTAAKRSDGRKCGTVRGSFKDRTGFEPCMAARGWVLDHVIPDPPSRHARNSRHDERPSVDNSSSSDDWVQRQHDQDNTQQMLNTQQMINNQQMQNDQMFQQQQQQMINDMNNH